MDSFFITAIVLGFFGSFHCLGMCGPLVLGLHSRFKDGNQVLISLKYHSGRIFVYSIFGVIVGYIGSIILHFTVFKIAAILSAIVVLLMGLYPFLNFKISLFNSFSFFQKYLPKIHQSSKNIRHFLLGMVNAFLPCGLIFIALGSSLGTLKPILGGVYMLFFGLGTIPALLILGVTSSKISFSFFNGKSKWVGLLLAIIIASLLIWRGIYVIPEQCCAVE